MHILIAATDNLSKRQNDGSQSMELRLLELIQMKQIESHIGDKKPEESFVLIRTKNLLQNRSEKQLQRTQ